MTIDRTVQLPQEKDSPTRGVGNDRHGPQSDERPRLQTRWCTVSEASKLLNTSEVAIRKRIVGGSLTAIRAGRGWRVLLPGDLTEAHQPDGLARGTIQTRTGSQLPQSPEALVSLVRDLQQQSLALAGQIGYLQSQLAGAQAEIQKLEVSQSKKIEERDEMLSAVSREEHEAVLQKMANLERIISVYDQAITPPQVVKKVRRWWHLRSS
ncbi:MAG: hypothetical protein NVSMB52_06150 [Chloroflexota bacterium]